MEFGKVPPEILDRIDLKLPPDDPRTRTALLRAGPGPLRIGVGAPVWAVKGWEGKVYPLDTSPRDFLFHYSRQFNSIELNTTHYRTPDRETIQRWREITPPGFRFCPKFPQEVSHRSPLSSRGDLAREFIATVMGLEDRLGLSFLQLPPHFSPSEGRDLGNFLKGLPRDFPLAVEVRHPAFFHDHQLHDGLYELLTASGTHVVITDVAGRRDVLHTSLPTSRVLIRMIGNDLHPTDEPRVQSWIERLDTWIQLGIREIEFFIHQPGDLTVPELISTFITHFNARTGQKVQNWKPMNQGQQLGLF